VSGQYESAPLGTSTTDAVMRAVRAAAGAHEILGEIGRHPDGRIAFLARDRSSGELTILQLAREPADPESGEPLELTELRTLDASVPAPGGTCHLCQGALVGWERHCPACGEDVTGVSQESAPGTSREAILEAVREATSGTYEILGDLPRAEGGGSVFFARELASGRLVALRLLQEHTTAGDAPAYSLGVTQLLKPHRPPPDAPSATSAPATEVKVCPQCGSEYPMDVRFCPNDGVALHVVSDGGGLVGQILADRYSVLRKLGEGGMGEVYLGEHVKMGRQCAIKVMRATMANDPAAAGRFGREAANASRINHPNVAIVYDFGETPDGIIYIAMELVDGEPLSNLIAREKALTVARATEICRQVAEALGAAHELGIVHRDLKPDNIMIVTKDGRDLVKVVDFGIAKAMQSGGTRLTRTGFVLGTPAYMSPEQIAGDVLDGRTDLYSLGCILFELLTGDVTFGGSSAETIISRRLTEPPPHPRALNAEVPPLLDDVVVAALARSPADRFQTAAELATALVQFTPSGERAATSAGHVLPEAVRRVSGERARRAASSAERPATRPWLRIAGVAGTVAVAAAAAFVWMQQQHATPRQTPQVSSTAPGPSNGAAANATDPAADATPMREPPTASAPDSSAAAGQSAVRQPATEPSSTPRRQSSATDTRPSADASRTPKSPARSASTPDREQRRARSEPADSVPRQPDASATVQRAPARSATQQSPPASSGATAARDTTTPAPVVPSPSPAADAAAQAALVRGVIARYVKALNDRQVDDMRTLYPAMSDRERDGFAALLKSATDLSAVSAGNPSVHVQDADATADFGYTLAFYLPSQGQQQSNFRWHATLHRGPNGWRIQTLAKTP
jgi:serine/threonine-protein kinase